MKKSIYIPIILIILSLALVLIYQFSQKPGATQSENMTSPSPVPTPAFSEPQTASPSAETVSKTYSLEEVALHDNKEDCWLVIDNKVYEVTSFIGQHPGGEAILQGCGKDATTLFKTRPMGSGTEHSQKAYNGLVNFYIGDLK